MKTIFTSLIIALGMTTCFTSCIWARHKGKEVTETRSVSRFSSISMESVAGVYFTQADTYSFSITGSEELVKNTTTEVKDGELRISHTKKLKNTKKGAVIRISAPDLERIDFDGVGSLHMEEKVTLNNLKVNFDGVGSLNVKDLNCHSAEFNVDGVGSVDVNIHCDNLRADVDGVGSATFTGSAKKASFHKDGIGKLDTSDLRIGE